MFPAPSPSAFYGSSTPGTLEFQKAALSAARKSSHPPPPLIPPPTSQDPKQDATQPPTLMDPMNNNNQHKPRQPSDQYNTDPAHHAANGLFMLAHVTGAPSVYPQAPHLQSGIPPNGPSAMDTSPNMAKRATVNSSAASTLPGSKFSGSAPANTVRGVSEMSIDRSESSMEPEPSSARKGRNNKSKATPANTGKRKNEEAGAGSKVTPNKKSKPTGRAMSMSDDGEEYDEDQNMQHSDSGKTKDGRKMTDEEKRKNFLERNRYVCPL